MTVAPFKPQDFLSSNHLALYRQVFLSLQQRIEYRLIADGNPQQIKIAQLVLEVASFDQFEDPETKERFFHTLLDSRECGQQLEKVLGICRRGGAKVFFGCVATLHNTYHSAETLQKIIQDFDEVAQATDQSLEPLARCPHYDLGGKDLLAKLKRQLPSTEESAVPRELAPVERPRDLDCLNDFHSFSQMKRKAIAYLNYLPAATRSSIKTYLKVFKNVQKLMASGLLSDAAGAASLKLIVLSSIHLRDLSSRKISISDFDELIQGCVLIHRNWGEGALLSICNASDLHTNPDFNRILSCLNLLNLLSSQEGLPCQIKDQLQAFSKGALTLIKFVDFLEDLAPEVHSTAPHFNEDVQPFIERFKKDSNVTFPLPDRMLAIIEAQYLRVDAYCETWKHLRIGQLAERASQIQAEGENSGFTEEHTLQLLAIGRLACFIKFQTYPYCTQVLTILAQMAHEKGAVAQVKTGEGKSLIVTLFAFVKAMQKKSVHIVSSDGNLAKRDRDKAASFFEIFDLSTSHICDLHPAADCFQAQILYGAASDFEFAIMREMLNLESLFLQEPTTDGSPRFDCILIDEQDNLTIDTASSNSRLSYFLEETYQWAYFPIFDYVKKNFSQEKQQRLLKLYVPNLRASLRQFAGGKFSDVVREISDEQLEKWLVSACQALHSRKENIDYAVVKVKHEEPKQKRIVIVDKDNTGRLKWGCRWQNGLHEFVEVKHDLTPERESLNPISLSHAVFYQMYKALYGLSGTVGSEFDREGLKEIYGISSFDVPTYRQCQRIDHPVKIVPSKQHLLQSIQESVISCRAKGRPILNLCETIADSLEIQKLLQENHIPLKMLNEIQEEEEEEILRRAGYPGAVTVATNTAGRGTDIILKENSEENGGLLSRLNFYPDSDRVEWQGRGRAGRQGQNGSSEVVVSLDSLGLDSTIDVTNLQIHDALVESLAQRRALKSRLMKNLQVVQAENERFCFTLVKQFFDSFGQFHKMAEQEGTLRQWATKLATRKLKPRETDLSSLRPKDRQIAEGALALMQDPAENIPAWQILLKKAAERLEHNLINDWSLQFYQKTGELFDRSEAIAGYWLQTQIQQVTSDMQRNLGDGPAVQFYQVLVAALADHQQKSLSDLKKELQVLYNSRKDKWEKTLHPSGSGIIQYLREITQTALRGLDS